MSSVNALLRINSFTRSCSRKLLIMAKTFERVKSMRDKCCCVMSKSPVREALAECFATFILVVLGDGVMANSVLGRLNLNSVVSCAFGWGFAVMLAVAVSAGISGGHVNPAVTIGLACVKKCPLKLVLPFIAAQCFGSFLAASVVYVTYRDAMQVYDGGFREIPPSINSTAQIFATYPQDFASSVTCFLDEVIATALLLIIICAATDSKNLCAPRHSQPIVIGVGVTAIILAFGHNCGAPLNPARDLLPRIFTAISGWGVGVFSFRNYEWFWIPVIAPIVGGIVGVWIYKFFIEIPFEDHSKTPEGLENSGSHTDESCSEDKLEASIPNSSVDIPDERICEPLSNKVRDAKLAIDACNKFNLMKQDV